MADGMILWEGKSELDGQPIVAIATNVVYPSHNLKTGPMVQIWILCQDVAPNEAQKTGQDTSVCGDCRMRNGACYVNTFHAPLAIWKCYKRGGYKPMRLDGDYPFRYKDVRLGAYGDPAAVPFEVWEFILEGAASWTGYTHQWRTCDPRFVVICMASCDDPTDYIDAQIAGWRTYRTRLPGEAKLEGEIDCPHYDKGVQCVKCGLCDGAKADGRRSIVAEVHGTSLRTSRYSALRVVA